MATSNERLTGGRGCFRWWPGVSPMAADERPNLGSNCSLSSFLRHQPPRLEAHWFVTCVQAMSELPRRSVRRVRWECPSIPRALAVFHQLEQPLELVPSSWVDLQFAAFPPRPRY